MLESVTVYQKCTINWQVGTGGEGGGKRGGGGRTGGWGQEGRVKAGGEG